jgi:hypothetical protein
MRGSMADLSSGGTQFRVPAPGVDRLRRGCGSDEALLGRCRRRYAGAETREPIATRLIRAGLSLATASLRFTGRIQRASAEVERHSGIAKQAMLLPECH